MRTPGVASCPESAQLGAEPISPLVHLAVILSSLSDKPRWAQNAHAFRNSTGAKRLSSVLVVEDEPNLADTIAYSLKREGYTTATVGDGFAAVQAAHEHAPDVVILDIMLPGIDGLEVHAFTGTSSVPILMLTARTEEMDRVVGLEVGADDYLSKPFSMRELLARVRALLRRRALIQEEMAAQQPATGQTQ